MKQTFPEYYPPSPEDIKIIWKEGLFVLDTNVLLNLYQYSKTTSDNLFKVLETIGDRLWIPYHVGFEFHKNRLNVLVNHQNSFDRLIRDLKSAINTIKKNYPKHLFIRIEEIEEIIGEAITHVEETRDEVPDLLSKDTILERISSLLEDRVGKPYSKEEMEQLYQQAAKRFAENLPPGITDSEKNGKLKYGDFIIWKQILDKAKEESIPIIFINDEKKNDWWQKTVDNKLIGPHPLLRKEMLDHCNVELLMYRAESLIQHSETYLGLAFEDEEATITVEEIESVSEEGEDEVVVGEELIQSSDVAERVFSYNTNIESVIAKTSSSSVSKPTNASINSTTTPVQAQHSHISDKDDKS